jgi:hypothetical protein
MKSNLQFLNHEHPEELSSGGSRYRQTDTLKLVIMYLLLIWRGT